MGVKGEFRVVQRGIGQVGQVGRVGQGGLMGRGASIHYLRFTIWGSLCDPSTSSG